MRRYRLTIQAETDVLGIWLYIATNNIDAADRVVDHFTETFQQLAAHPGMGVTREEYHPQLA